MATSTSYEHGEETMRAGMKELQAWHTQRLLQDFDLQDVLPWEPLVCGVLRANGTDCGNGSATSYKFHFQLRYNVPNSGTVTLAYDYESYFNEAVPSDNTFYGMEITGPGTFGHVLELDPPGRDEGDYIDEAARENEEDCEPEIGDPDTTRLCCSNEAIAKDVEASHPLFLLYRLAAAKPTMTQLSKYAVSNEDLKKIHGM